LSGGDAPARKVAASDIEHLALAHQLLHRLPDLFPWSRTLYVVHLVQIAVIGLQPPQTVLAGFADMIGRQAPIIWAFTHLVVHFSCQDNTVPASPLSQPAPDDLLRTSLPEPSTVNIGCIEEVDPMLQRRIHNRKAVGLAGV